MKKVVFREIVEEEGEGLASFLGKEIILFCMNYFYTGTMVGIDEEYVRLDNGGIVFETGAFSDKKWKDFQKMGNPLYVQRASIEAFSAGKTKED